MIFKPNLEKTWFKTHGNKLRLRLSVEALFVMALPCKAAGPA